MKHSVKPTLFRVINDMLREGIRRLAASDPSGEYVAEFDLRVRALLDKRGLLHLLAPYADGANRHFRSSDDPTRLSAWATRGPEIDDATLHLEAYMDGLAEVSLYYYSSSYASAKQAVKISGVPTDGSAWRR